MSEPDLLQQAIDTLNTGDRAGTARLLAQVVSQDPHDETAWLWLAACLDDIDKKRYCLQKAIELNPANDAARQDLAHLADMPAVPAATQEDIHLPQSLEASSPPVQVVPPSMPVVEKPASPKRARMSGVELFVIILLVIAILSVIAVVGYLVLTNQFTLPEFITNLFR